MEVNVNRTYDVNGLEGKHMRAIESALRYKVENCDMTAEERITIQEIVKEFRLGELEGGEVGSHVSDIPIHTFAEKIAPLEFLKDYMCTEKLPDTEDIFNTCFEGATLCFPPMSVEIIGKDACDDVPCSLNVLPTIPQIFTVVKPNSDGEFYWITEEELPELITATGKLDLVKLEEMCTED